MFRFLCYASLLFAALTTNLPAQSIQAGRQAFNHGHFAQAIEAWEAVLPDIRDQAVRSRIQVDIAKACRELGLYTKARRHLEAAAGELTAEAYAAHAEVLNEQSKLVMSEDNRRYAEAHKLAGHALENARQAGDARTLAGVSSQWGNLLSVGLDYVNALKAHAEAVALAATLPPAAATRELRGKIALNHAGTLVAQDLEYAPESAAGPAAFQSSIKALEQALPLSRDWADRYQQIFALLQLGKLAQRIQARLAAPEPRLHRLIGQALPAALKLAEEIQHAYAQSHVHGQLGEWYYQHADYARALNHSRRALFFARGSEGAVHRWQRLQGRIYRAQGHLAEAIAAYRRSAQALRRIRHQTAATGYRPAEAFRDQIAPVYFELADLLLRRATALKNTGASALVVEESLQQARQAIEYFKQAELQDYFQSECIANQADCSLLDEFLDEHTAVLYPVLLPDRLELLLSLPDGMAQFTVMVDETTLRDHVTLFLSPLRHHPHPQERARNRTARGVQSGAAVCFAVERGSVAEQPEHAFRFLESSRQLYQWLIQPLQARLQAQEITTLIVVPDSVLRTIPFAALHDGEQYLIEQYAIAVTPGLCLNPSQSHWRRQPAMLLGGISEAVQAFPAIPCAKHELETLHDLYGKQNPLLLNKNFTLPQIGHKAAQQNYSVLHIASHGEFNAEVEKSFILTYEDKLTLDKLEKLTLLSRIREEPIELLTLSACETAKGNDRAALGLAGVALKAGTKSALASLWQVDDNATPAVVIEFYRQLQNTALNKAQALQSAQQLLLNGEMYEKYRHPYYWAAFLMIGDWH